MSATGAMSILPPSTDKTTIGGVKQGRGILIDPDGTINVSTGPSGVYLLDNITFNGTDTDFNLTVDGNPYKPLNQNYLIIAVGGVIQQYPQAYTLAGSTISFTAAPPAGAIFYGIAFG